MDTVLSILKLLWSIISDKTILIFEVNQLSGKGEFEWVLFNKSKVKVKIKEIWINGVEINKIQGLLEQKEFPFSLNSSSKITWKFILMNTNSDSKPQNVTIVISRTFGRKKYNISL